MLKRHENVSNVQGVARIARAVVVREVRQSVTLFVRDHSDQHIGLLSSPM